MTVVESAWTRFPDYRIELVPSHGVAEVRAGGALLARSSKAFRLIETDHVERLYVPEADVRLDLLRSSDHRTICPFKGEATYWSYTGADGDVEDLFWTYRAPFAEVAGIEGYLGIYHEKPGLDVEVVTEWPDGTTSGTRFPAWGDQDDLMRLLAVREVHPSRYSAEGYGNQQRNVVEGGQILGAAIVAAADSLPAQRVTWAAATFVRAAAFSSPLDFDVDELRSGRTFSTREVRVAQGGKLVAPVLLLADSGAPDCIRHGEGMPDVAKPEHSTPLDMGVVGRALRVVDGAYDPDPDRTGPPELHVWIRYRDNPSALAMRQALVAQASTHWTIAAAMRPHRGFGEAMAHVSLSTGPVALSMAFHDDRPLDEWFLYTTSAAWAGNGLAHGDGKVFSHDGALVATYSLQAMIRDLLGAAEGKDASVAM